MGFALGKKKDIELPRVEHALELPETVSSAEALAAQKILDDLCRDIEKMTSNFVAKYIVKKVVARFKKDEITPQGRLYIAAELFKNFGGGIKYAFPEPCPEEFPKASQIIDDVLRMVGNPIVKKLIDVNERVSRMESEISNLSRETIAAMANGFFARIELLTRE